MGWFAAVWQTDDQGSRRYATCIALCWGSAPATEELPGAAGGEQTPRDAADGGGSDRSKLCQVRPPLFYNLSRAVKCTSSCDEMCTSSHGAVRMSAITWRDVRHHVQRAALPSSHSSGSIHGNHAKPPNLTLATQVLVGLRSQGSRVC